MIIEEVEGTLGSLDLWNIILTYEDYFPEGLNFQCSLSLSLMGFPNIGSLSLLVLYR
jgi:hypothetical protein